MRTSDSFRFTWLLHTDGTPGGGDRLFQATPDATGKISGRLYRCGSSHRECRSGREKEGEGSIENLLDLVSAVAADAYHG